MVSFVVLVLLAFKWTINDAINIQINKRKYAKFSMVTLLKTQTFLQPHSFKMNSKKHSIAKALNNLCSSHLTDSDQAELEGFIEEFFFDESQEEEDPDPPSKIDKNEYINYE